MSNQYYWRTEEDEHAGTRIYTLDELNALGNQELAEFYYQAKEILESSNGDSWAKAKINLQNVAFLIKKREHLKKGSAA